MTVLTTDQMDREIRSRTAEVEAMSATLVELDSHPGLEHVRRYPPTGVTARSLGGGRVSARAAVGGAAGG